MKVNLGTIEVSDTSRKALGIGSGSRLATRSQVREWALAEIEATLDVAIAGYLAQKERYG